MTIEDIVLDYSTRGMDILKNDLGQDYIRKAAEAIVRGRRGTVFIITGFYVEGRGETDGPPGAYYLAKGLEMLGFRPIIIADILLSNLFPGVCSIYMTAEETGTYERLLRQYEPVCCISIERCGRNRVNDYTNMRGKSIKDKTAPLDEMILLAASYGIPTFGIGDGGNEIGMGNLKDSIERKLGIDPCVVCVDYLMIATVSNWAAYGLLAYLKHMTGTDILPDFTHVEKYYAYIVACGCIDGVTKNRELSVDGFGMETEERILARLKKVIG